MNIIYINIFLIPFDFFSTSFIFFLNPDKLNEIPGVLAHFLIVCSQIMMHVLLHNSLLLLYCF